ncbi:MAG: N-acetyltransferase family protein [Gemmatimonadota bacterium]
MSDRCNLRKATEDDLDELVGLWSHYIRVHRKNPAYQLCKGDGLAKRRKVFAEHVAGPDSCVFVMERPDGGLDGMITCFVERNTPYFMPPHYGRIQTPFVRPEARNQGYLKQLLAASYRWARELELTEVRLFTSAFDPGPNRLAEEFGFEAFEIVRRRPIEWDYPQGKTPFDERDD